MSISIDNKQRLKSLCYCSLEFYKVVMGTLLLLFIPQTCGERSCSVMENISFERLDKNIVYAYNLFTLLIVFSVYIVELMRENWCIEYLDIDEDKLLDNLDEEIKSYPEIKGSMVKLNKKYYYTSLSSIIFILVNYILSCVYIIPNSYGTSTFTNLLSFGTLIVMKIYRSYQISLQSIKEDRSYSAYMTKFITYNTIDSDHKKIQNINSL